MPRGTEVVLHLKADAEALPRALRASSASCETYSDHILFPIELADKEGEPRQINAASAIWQRPKSELKPEDYTQAYRSIASAFDEPAMTLHYRAEGRQSYAVLLFVPSSQPFDLADPSAQGRGSSSMCAASTSPTMPSCCRPSCASCAASSTARTCRSTSRARCCRTIRRSTQIRKAVTSRVVAELESLADKDADTFTKIWDAFGRGPQGGDLRGSRAARPALALARFDHDRGRCAALAQAIRRRPQAQPDRDLLPRRRERRAAESPTPSSKRRARAASRCCC